MAILLSDSPCPVLYDLLPPPGLKSWIPQLWYDHSFFMFALGSMPLELSLHNLAMMDPAKEVAFGHALADQGSAPGSQFSVFV